MQLNHTTQIRENGSLEQNNKNQVIDTRPQNGSKLRRGERHILYATCYIAGANELMDQRLQHAMLTRHHKHGHTYTHTLLDPGKRVVHDAGHHTVTLDGILNAV